MQSTKSSSCPESEARWYEITREDIGLVYDPARVNASKYRGAMPRHAGWDKDYDVGKEVPEGHVDDSPPGRSIRDCRQVINPVEVDEDYNILDGFGRWTTALRYGIPCPIVIVRGLREEQKLPYIAEVNHARRDLDTRLRVAGIRHFIAWEEEEFRSGRIKHRSAYNCIAVKFSVSPRTVRQIERAEFPERWDAALAGERRVSRNGKLFEVKETDPEGRLSGLLAKLGDDEPLDHRVASIKAIREDIERFGDVLSPKRRKEILDQVDEADRRVRERRAAEERARADRDREFSTDGTTTSSEESADVSRASATRAQDNDPKPSIASLLQVVESEPAFADPDRRPFTSAVSAFLDQRLLPRDELTTDDEWAALVARVAVRGGVTVEDLLRLLLRRPSSLDPVLQVLDRLFLASGGDPAALRDSITKSMLMAILGQAA